MRTTPLVGSKPWFGPRRFGGWGWSPVSWEGWVVHAMSVVMMLGASVLPTGRSQAVGIVLGLVVLLAATILKGTSPGDSVDADRYRSVRALASRTPEEREADRQRRRASEDEPSVAEAVERLRRRQSPPAS